MDILSFLIVLGLIMWGFSRFSVGKRKPYRNLGGIKTATTADSLSSQNKQRARLEKRDAQLDALRNSVPSNPPEKMRATIQVNQFKDGRYEQQRVPKFLSEDTFENIEVGEDFKFSVDMILEMSEAERALVKEHELDDIVLEDIPQYNEEELAQFRDKDDQRIRAKKGYLNEAMERQFAENNNARRKAERLVTRVGDLLVSPYSREFETPHAAKDYADKLKTKFLPEVRKLLDRYRDHKPIETLEF